MSGFWTFSAASAAQSIPMWRRRCGVLPNYICSEATQPQPKCGFRQALDIRRACLGDRHPDTAESLNDLAWLLYQAGNPIHAEGLFRDTLRLRLECFGPTHPDTLASQHGLALVALARGITAAAADLLEQALAVIGDDHPQKLSFKHTLARAYFGLGNRARA